MSVDTEDPPSFAPDEPRRAAFREGVNTLFKFRRYSTDDERECVRDILVNHRVRFARASEFPDKNELRPYVDFRRGADEAATRALLLQAAEQFWARRATPYPEVELYRERLRTVSIEQLIAEATHRTHAYLDAQYWVFSLASSRDWVRMWDEYAAKATGLCIHFRSDRSSPFGLAQKVLYELQRPTMWVPLDPDITAVMDACFLTKARAYKHEREYRLIRYPSIDYAPHRLAFDGQFARFPPDALCGITIGLQMPAHDARTIHELAEAHEPPLVVEQPTGDTERRS